MDRRQFLESAVGFSGAFMFSGCTKATERAPGFDQNPEAGIFHGLRRYAKTTFGKIAYVERGSGSAALFLHGFPLNGFQWRDALQRLSPYRRCIAPDFLGMGFTQVAKEQGVGPDDQVAMLIAFLDQLNIDHVDVVANDSGGAVAQLLLVRHPRRVRTLLLTNCDTEIESPPPAMLPVIELAKQGTFVDQWLAPWHADPRKARSPEGIGGIRSTRPTTRLMPISGRCCPRIVARNWQMPTPSHSNAIRWRALKPSCAVAAPRHVWCGEGPTRSSLSRMRSICIVRLAHHKASAGSMTASCSGQKNAPT